MYEAKSNLQTSMLLIIVLIVDKNPQWLETDETTIWQYSEIFICRPVMWIRINL